MFTHASFLEPLFLNPTAVKRDASTAWVTSEDEEQWAVELDLPGVDPTSLDLEVEGPWLRLKGSRGETKVARTLRLPRGADSAGIRAELRLGVLTLNIPKAAAVRRRKIELSPLQA